MAPFAELDPVAAHARLGEFQVVDVRGDHEFHGPLGRVPGAVSIPLPELEQRAPELSRKGPLLLVCRSGSRSGRACEQLQALGFDSVVNLAGGMIAWNRAALVLERSEPASAAELLECIAAWVAKVGPLSLDAVRSHFGEQLQRAGSSLAEPSAAALLSLLLSVEALFAGAERPPDFELSLRAFRNALAKL